MTSAAHVPRKLAGMKRAEIAGPLAGVGVPTTVGT